MRARWPEAGEVNEDILKSSSYLQDVAHEFRTRLKAFMTVQKDKVSFGSKQFYSNSYFNYLISI
jgi:hypothetical protein